MGRPKTLFNTDVFDEEKIKIGVTPDSHVIHVFGEKDKDKGTEIKLKDENDLSGNFTSEEFTSGYNRVSHEEIFYNEADLKNRENFIELMQTSEKMYAMDFGPYDKDVKSVLDTVRDYVCSSSRHGQQDALKNMQFAMHKLLVKVKKDAGPLMESAKTLGGEQNLYPKQKEQLQHIEAALNLAELFKGSIINPAMGNLEAPKEDAEVHKASEEPIIYFFGKRPKDFAPGNWEPTNDALFPHEPSPNDVKQGLGLQSCYMLSALTTIAAKHPEKIKEAMKDNGDGTVTVRFFRNTQFSTYKERKKPVYETVYVTVNKTINKSYFNNNLYASSSVWVQMMEKAYAEYVAINKRKKENDPDLKTSMLDVDKGDSSEFTQCLLGGGSKYMLNIRLNAEQPFYRTNDKLELINHPPYYLPEELAVFRVLDHAVNQRKEPITTGALPTNHRDQKQYNNIGIRTGHKYAINKVFSKMVNGKPQYFVQLRDPYATFELKYDNEGKHLEESKLDVIKANKNAGLENMGAFNIELKDFISMFSSSIVNASEETYEEMEAEAKKFRNYSPTDNYIKVEGHPLTEEEMKGEEFYHTEFAGSLGEYEEKMEQMYEPSLAEDSKDDFQLSGDEPKQEEKKNPYKIDFGGDDFGGDDFGEPEENVKPKEEKKQKSKLDEFLMDEDELDEPEKQQPENPEYNDMDLSEFEMPAEFDDVQLLANSLDDEIIFKIAQNLTRSRNELDATDGLFVLTNTQPFKDMKKNLESLTNELASMVQTKGMKKSDFLGSLDDVENYDVNIKFSPDEKYSIAKKLKSLQTLASNYADKKYNAVISANAKSSDYSERAISRFAIATDIKNVCNLDYPQSDSPRRSANLLAMYYIDLMQNVSILCDKKDKSLGLSLDDETAAQRLSETLSSIKQTKAFFAKNTELNTAIKEIINSKEEYKNIVAKGEEDYKLETVGVKAEKSKAL